MKSPIIYIGILLCAAACSKSHVAIESGDMLFCAGKSSEMGGAIVAATGSGELINFTHMGIYAGADSVIEATTDGGVRRVSLQKFLAEASTIDKKPAVVAMRLRDTTGISKALRRANELIGLPYDYSFRHNNGKYYCSELVWECFRTRNDTPRFTAHPMQFRAADGSMPLYWIKLFASTGDIIPEGELGSNPASMSRENILREVCRWW